MDLETRIRKLENSFTPEIDKIKAELNKGKYLNEVINQDNIKVLLSNPKLLREVQKCTTVVFIPE